MGVGAGAEISLGGGFVAVTGVAVGVGMAVVAGTAVGNGFRVGMGVGVGSWAAVGFGLGAASGWVQAMSKHVAVRARITMAFPRAIRELLLSGDSTLPVPYYSAIVGTGKPLLCSFTGVVGLDS